MTTYTLSGQGPFSGGNVASGNILELTAGQTIINFDVFGTVEVINNSIASGTVIEDGGELLDAFGSLSEATIINSGGTVVDQGVVALTTINSGGTQLVSSLPTHLAFAGTSTVAGGTQIVQHGFVRSTTVDSGGSDLVSSGGTSSNSIISSGGFEYVYSGGTAVSATVSSGGFEIVSSGGTAIGPLLSGGTVALESGGVVSGGVNFAGSGGTLEIFGTAISTAVISGFVSGNVIDFVNQPNLTLEAAYYAGDTNEVDLYNKSTLVAQLYFSGGVSTTTLEPINDGTGGTEIIVDPTSATLSDPQFSQLVGSSSIGTGGTITWSFIHTNEGGNWLNPYVPFTAAAAAGAKSGVTIGIGVDLANGITQPEFASLFPNYASNPNLLYLYNATAPAQGSPGPTGAQALAYLNSPNGAEQTIQVNNIYDLASVSVSITHSQANTLTVQAETDTLQTLVNEWTGTVSVSALPSQAQTALADLAYNYGNLPVSTPTTWGDIIAAADTISSVLPYGSTAAWNVVVKIYYTGARVECNPHAKRVKPNLSSKFPASRPRLRRQLFRAIRTPTVRITSLP
jgi:autotransporter passenger strand-loop-strand repeat protein